MQSFSIWFRISFHNFLWNETKPKRTGTNEPVSGNVSLITSRLPLCFPSCLHAVCFGVNYTRSCNSLLQDIDQILSARWSTEGGSLAKWSCTSMANWCISFSVSWLSSLSSPPRARIEWMEGGETDDPLPRLPLSPSFLPTSFPSAFQMDGGTKSWSAPRARVQWYS